MIKTAQQIMAELAPEKERTYPKNRRSRNLPVMVCKNWYRGCTGRTKEKNSGNGHCRRCYDRKRRYGDSWYHSPNMRRCGNPKCFMLGKEGHR